VNASAEAEDLETVGAHVRDAVLVVVTRSDGEAVGRMMDAVEARGGGGAMVMVAVEPEGHVPESETEAEAPSASSEARQTGTPTTKEGASKPPPSDEDGGGRVLFLNGHPLLNTRLLV